MRKLLLTVTALLALASPASAYTIDILGVFDRTILTPSTFSGQTVDTFAGAGTNDFVSPAGFNTSGTFSYTATLGSGLFAGNVPNGTPTLQASPFGNGNATSLYLSASGGGGAVGLTSLNGTRDSLSLLWGTVDSGDYRNRITTIGGSGFEFITGSQILAACAAEEFSCTDGQTNVFVRITGLADFSAVKFSDRDANSFEFVPLAAAVPEPATWAMMLIGFAGVGFAAMRKRRQSTQMRLA